MLAMWQIKIQNRLFVVKELQIKNCYVKPISGNPIAYLRMGDVFIGISERRILSIFQTPNTGSGGF